MEEIKTMDNSKTTYSRDDGLPWLKKLALAVLIAAILISLITALGQISSRGRAAIIPAGLLRLAGNWRQT